MQFTVQPLPARPDLDRIEAALTDLDPAALVDFDAVASALRLSTLLEPIDILQALATAGVDVAPEAVHRQPSECCGGCGG